MARHIKLKARASSIEALRPRPSALADPEPESITLADTFFACAIGRLKLRATFTRRVQALK